MEFTPMALTNFMRVGITNSFLEDELVISEELVVSSCAM
jgi:hypothetical protein